MSTAYRSRKAGQDKLSLACFQLFRVGTLILLLLFTVNGLGPAKAIPPGKREGQAGDVIPFYLMRRIIVLNIPPPQGGEAPLQRLVTQQRERQANRKRRRNRFRLNLTPPQSAPKQKIYPIYGKTKSKPKAARDPDVVPPEQRMAAAQGLLADALVQRLRDQQGIVTPSEAEVRAALKRLGLTLKTAQLPDNAERLCAALECQAMLIPRVTQVIVQDRVTRDALLFAEVTTAGTPPVNTVDSLPERVRATGVAHVSHKWFHAIYLQTQGAILSAAAQEAAAMVVHTLRTGQEAPFTSPSVRVGIAPVPAPPTADELQFLSEGRRVVPEALRGLPTEATELFTPDLLPLPLSAVRIGVAANPLSLWTSLDRVNLPRARALARRMGVDYLLLARVTSIELASGPPDTLTAPSVISDTGGISQEARATTVGVLVRASDGALLWEDHASAAQATPPGDPGDVRHAVHSAVHYALVALTSQFTHYRESFTQ